MKNKTPGILVCPLSICDMKLQLNKAMPEDLCTHCLFSMKNRMQRLKEDHGYNIPRNGLFLHALVTFLPRVRCRLNPCICTSGHMFGKALK